MHSIIFAQETIPDKKAREVRVTEKVKRDGVTVYSRRKSFYKVILEDVKIPVSELNLKPELYIYKNINEKRKFFSWRLNGITKVPQSRKKSLLIAYEHTFWILIKDTL